MTLTAIKQECLTRIIEGEVKYSQPWMAASKDWEKELKEEILDAINYASRMNNAKGWILHKAFILIALFI